jgi:cobalt-zinc-cadmium efflux system protein
MSGTHRHSDGNHFAGHEHGDSAYTHRSRPQGARPLAIAVALTLGYALIELAGGLWSGSLALLADAGHMATDSAALLFALAANIIARRPVSDRYSFGLARVEVIAAFVNSLAMMAVVAWIFYEAINRLTTPVPVQGLGVFAIATIGLLINIAVAWSLSRDRENVNTRAALVHVMGDLLGSVAAILSTRCCRCSSPR